MKLIELEEGQTALITRLDVDEVVKRRLLHLGIYVSARIRIEKKGKRGKPFVVFLCGNFLMLRYQVVECIEVEVSEWKSK